MRGIAWIVWWRAEPALLLARCRIDGLLATRSRAWRVLRRTVALRLPGDSVALRLPQPRSYTKPLQLELRYSARGIVVFGDLNEYSATLRHISEGKHFRKSRP